MANEVFEVLNYVEYLKLAGGAITAVVVIFFIMQIIGEISEFTGKTVPTIMKVFKLIREGRRQRKIERNALHELPDKLSQLDRIYSFLDTVEKHYSADNISKRNEWMDWVNTRAEVYDAAVGELTSLKNVLEANNALTLNMYITIYRNMILEFASKVANEDVLISREEFNRIFTVYEDYEEELKKHDMTNGQVDIAYAVIKDAYKERLADQKFLEDVRGYK